MDTPEPITVADHLDLVRTIDDPARERAVVIVSACHRGDRLYGLSPRRLARALGDRAQVWLLPSIQLNTAFSDAWPTGTRGDRAVYGGAVRVIGAQAWTAVVRTDIRTESEVIARIVRGLDERDGAQQPEPAHCLPLNGTARAAEVPAAASTPPSGTSEPERPSGQHSATVIARLRRELEQVQAHAAELAARVAELEAAAEVPSVFADPEQQLRHEIELTWLQHLPEAERSQWPLRDYVIGPHLLPLATELATRDRILAVIVDVLTRRANTMPARGVHPHHDRRASGTAMVRADGATAYRAYVKCGAPGAARLLWWELVDGRVELAQVGHHDAVLRTRAAG